MENVQLTGKERTVVYRCLDTGRILGFGIEGAPPNPFAVKGFRFEAVTVYHARDLDRFMDQYREQHVRDEEHAAVAKLEKEREFRKGIRDSIIARNLHLDQWNQDINLRMLDAQDKIYERILTQRIRALPKLAAELYEEGGDDERIIKDSAKGAI